VVDSFVQALPETERTPGAIIQRLRIECTPDHFSESQALNVVGKLLEVSYSEFGSSVAPSQNETEWSSREDVALLLARLAALNETWSDAGQLDVGLQSMCTITRRDPDSVRRRVSELLPIERNVHPLITLYRTVQQLMDAVISDGELHTQDTHGWSNREDMSLLLARFASLDETCSDAGQLDTGLERLCLVTGHGADDVRRRLCELSPAAVNVHPAVSLCASLEAACREKQQRARALEPFAASKRDQNTRKS
jgi:hypothetical protein